MNFYNQLIYLIGWTLQLPTHRIVPTTELKDDLNLDDNDFNLLIFRIEHYYKIEFNQEEIQEILSVKDLGKLIVSKASSAKWSEPDLYAAYA